MPNRMGKARPFELATVLIVTDYEKARRFDMAAAPIRPRLPSSQRLRMPWWMRFNASLSRSIPHL